MRIFVAQLDTETNTFVAASTGWEEFAQYGIYYADASVRAPQGVGALLRFLRNLIESDGNEMVESVCAFAQPSGRTVRLVYESLRDRILSDLRAAMPVQAVQMILHGAMVADGYDDCEGDLLSRVRAIVGPDVPVGAQLDLHCHFTELKRTSADVIVALKEYPHIDAEHRARELCQILLSMALGHVRPTMAAFDCRMVGLWHTTREPMRSFVNRLQSFEGHDGVLSISLGHGFPWGDVPESGARLWVVTDDDPKRAALLCERLGFEFWNLREQTAIQWLSVDAAIDLAFAADAGPTVIADVADNPGGGAPGDSTFILQRMLERRKGDAVLGAFWDPAAVQACSDAGIGAVIKLRVGGHCGAVSGSPVDIQVVVRALAADHVQTGLGFKDRLGAAVWVEGPGNLHLVLASVRTQVLGTDAFTALGLTLEDKKLIVVKSTQHFHAQFAPIARQVLYVATPGALTPDFADIPYRVRDTNYWPRVADPHGLTTNAR
jgi:microcystin degradation protein MlrC